MGWTTRGVRWHRGWNIGMNQENPGSNSLAAVSKRRQFHSLHVASVHAAVYMRTYRQWWIYERIVSAH